MSKLRKTTLSGKIALIFAVFLIVMMSAVVIILQIDSTAMADEIVEAETAASITGLGARITTMGEELAAKANVFASSPALSDALAIEGSAALPGAFNQIYRVQNPTYAFLTDTSGTVLYSSDPAKDFSGQSFTAAALNSANSGMPFFGDASLSYAMMDGQIYAVSSMPISSYGLLRGSVSCLELLSSDKMLDGLKQLTGCEFSIIKEDVRVSTTLIKENVRENGTKISSAVAKSIADTKSDYKGKVEIFGKKCSVVYHPILDKSGEIAFIAFTAIDISAVETRKLNAQLFCIVLIVIAAGVSVAASVLYLNATVKRPVKQIVRVVDNFRSGQVGISDSEAVAIETTATDEIGQIATALRGTADSLKGYIGEILAVLGSISRGDLTIKTSDDFVGDFVGVKQSLDGILSSLSGIIRRISDSAGRVSGFSERITGISGQLASGATMQAATVQELSASLLEVSTQTKANAAAANAAADVSKQTTGEVATGQKKMEEMLDSMKDINTASGEIEKIIKTIDDIAFQTNILALNAAVEAARAGNAGKGFAVVADEVRNLASKSAEAARQTTQLIHNTISLVDGGTKIANSTAESFGTIIKSTEHSTDLIGKIAAATNEQALSIAQINEGMNEISAVIQNTSATAEESAATAVELSAQANEMENIVGMFKF